MIANFGAFLALAALVIVTPGPDMALVLRNALVGGRAAGVLTGVGVVTGLLCWTLAASAGLAALIVASEPAFLALKLAGAAYLVWLGIQALRGALRRGSKASAEPDDALARRAPGGGHALRQGLLSNLANPKIAVFFTSLLPQFTVSGEASFTALLALGLVFCAITLAWLTAYACAVARVGAVLRRPAVRRWLDALTGGVLVALGVRLAAEQRPG